MKRQLMDELEEKEEECSWDDDMDGEFKVPEPKKASKIDIMGKISNTADARGVSIRDRTVIAASVCNAVGININDTNIGVSSAWRSAQGARLSTAEQVKEKFVCSEKVSLHWDGKVLKMKGNIKSNRIAVYVVGTDGEKVRKLLGIPDSPGGTGFAESEVVKRELIKWEIRNQVVSLYFDTTATNSSGEVGASHYLELWVDHPLLWTACRHHIYELHVNRVTEAITGQTKDPGVSLFRHFKLEWNSLQIDYGNLNYLDYDSIPVWLAEEAQSVLSWGEREL